jgi:hypothetical protein
MADYVAGELPLSTDWLFECHVEECAPCRTYLTSYEQTLKLAKLAFDDEPGTEIPQDLVKTILAACRHA